jgi:FlaA1/EpsC-like NDP-sugar epimerase
MFKNAFGLSRSLKKIVLVLIDLVSLILVLLASFSIRLGYWYFPESGVLWLVFVAPVIAIPIFIRFGLYRTVIRHIGFNALWSVLQATSLYALLWGVVSFMVAVEGVPRSVILINWILSILIISGVRIAIRWILIKNKTTAFGKKPRDNRKVALVYGAGNAGIQLASALEHSYEYRLVGFIDDYQELQGNQVRGLHVYSADEISGAIKRYEVSEILIAIPSISRAKQHAIIERLENYLVLVRLIPGVTELAEGKVSISDLREVSIEDLLGRDAVLPNRKLLSKNITGKVVMVTGAGGSIGSEMCRQIIKLNPDSLVLYELNELALYQINQELAHKKVDIYPLLGSVNNINRLSQVLSHFKVNTIYHAAAYKHVPIVEFNNTEGVSNNVFGTLSVAQAAINAKVETFVLISTDKAVRPTNTMGATKRCAEQILQALSVTQKSTIFTMVRFGNVLGSSGSVIPLFTQQIKSGGPITITDKNIIRYFMTIPEAVELVIQAGAMATGGEVFVLDMGQPIRIVDLAKKMIHLSGLEVKDKSHPNGDIELEYTGLRPGEKLFEELLIGGSVSKTGNSLIMRAEEKSLSWDELKPILDKLNHAVVNCNQERVRDLLIQIVPDFKPQCNISDALYRCQK